MTQGMTQGMQQATKRGARWALVTGWIATLIALLGVGGWATRAQIASAIVAPGMVDATPHITPIQHLEGGTISALMVQEAQQVSAGQALLHLDATILQRERDLIDGQITDLHARRTRLRIEREGTPWPASVPTGAQDAALDAQHRLFQARIDSLNHQAAQLAEQDRQTAAEIAGLLDQAAALNTEIALSAQGLDTQRALVDRGLAPQSSLHALERDAARLTGTQAALRARTAQLRAQRAEIVERRQSLFTAFRVEAEAALAEVETTLNELRARRNALDQRLQERIVRSPIDGHVQGVVVQPGGVLRPGQTAMHVVAAQGDAAVIVLIDPDEIERVHIGQAAQIHVAAFGADLPQALEARVATIPPSPVEPERGGPPVYRVALALTAQGRAALGGARLLPGMTLQGFIPTGQRTPADYLLAPITRRLRYALRDP